MLVIAWSAELERRKLFIKLVWVIRGIIQSPASCIQMF